MVGQLEHRTGLSHRSQLQQLQGGSSLSPIHEAYPTFKSFKMSQNKKGKIVWYL
jgi:hypothetical protein